MMTQLNPPIPLETPKGKGYAHFMIDYSQEHDLQWVIFIDDTGECWTFPNREVRMQKNITLGRSFEKKPLRNSVPINAQRNGNLLNEQNTDLRLEFQSS